MRNISNTNALQIERGECVSMLRRRAALSAVASATPIPGVDIATDISLLLDVLPKISDRFGFGADQIRMLDAEGAAIFMKTTRSLGSTLIGKAVTRALITTLARSVGVRLTAKQATKYIPAFGAVVAAAIGYSAFMKIGKRHIDQCIAVRCELESAIVPASYRHDIEGECQPIST